MALLSASMNVAYASPWTYLYKKMSGMEHALKITLNLIFAF
jgi:hypothetical protein